MHHPTDRIAHTTAFVTPVVEHWLGRKIAQWVHPMKDRSDDPSHHERTLLPRSYISLSAYWNHILVTIVKNNMNKLLLLKTLIFVGSNLQDLMKHYFHDSPNQIKKYECDNINNKIKIKN